MHTLTRGREVLALKKALQACLALTMAVAAACGMPGPVHAATAQRPTPQSLCSSGAFRCVMIETQLDYANPARGKTIVVFAVLPARKPAKRKGVLVTIIGGPGASGIAVAEAYAASYAPELRDQFDLAFFDQRGVGLSGNLRCEEASAAYNQTEMRADTSAEERRMIDNARVFATNCQAMLGDPAELPFYSTRHAIEDLEAFRKEIGEQKLWLYGESYGTQFAQWYAAVYPQHVAGMVLDGVVDLNVRGTRFASDQTAAFNATLVKVLTACNADTRCRRDAGGDALRAYDTLARTLKAGPVSFEFRRADGRVERRALTLSDLETAAMTYLYSAGDRMVLQRAIAFASRGDYQPLAHMFYVSIGLNPQTRAKLPDPRYSDAAYYAVNCGDNRYFEGAPDERARQYMKAGDRVDAEIPRLNSVFYIDLPCVFWPGSVSPPALDASRSASVPAFILTASADPATPEHAARAVSARFKRAALLVQANGPHVIFGRGNACVDGPVIKFLLTGQLPAERETVCDGELTEPYVAIPPVTYREADDALAALIAIDNHLRLAPAYLAWPRLKPLHSACEHAGDAVVKTTGRADAIALNGCETLRGFVLSGSGTLSHEDGVFVLTVDVRGEVSGRLEYTRDARGHRVVGKLNGRVVNIQRGR